MAREIGSWLSGPRPLETHGAPGSRDRRLDDYPGQRLGLPETGSGSIARFGRRTAALMIDWFISFGLVGLTVTVGLISQNEFLYGRAGSTAIAVVWLVLGVLGVRLFGFTPGQFALGLRVGSMDDRMHVGTGRAVVRGLLLFLVVPALFTDRDLRGLHDLATRTAVVRR